MKRQHRTSLFQVIVIGTEMRLIRWDHAGAVVSERHDYLKNPQYLSEFLWRFSHMNDMQRGMDPTVRLASKKEISLFTEHVKSFLGRMSSGTRDGPAAHRLPKAELSLDGTGTYPTWKIHIAGEGDEPSTDLIVKRPFAGHSSMFGRATRAYIAYNLAEHRIVFFKDTWRPDHNQLYPETDIYRKLRAHGIPHVPTALYGGDVRSGDGRLQETITHLFAEDEDQWRVTGSTFDRYVHHRIVQDIAYPLESATNVKEFIQAFHDALLGKVDCRFICFRTLLIRLRSD